MSNMNMIPQKGRSSLSQRSRSFSQYVSNCGSLVDQLTDEELYKQVENLKRYIKILKLENEILENAIKRLDPALMQGVHQALEYAIKVSAGSASNINLRAASFLRSNNSKLLMVESTSKSFLLGLPNSKSIILSPSRTSASRTGGPGSSKTANTVMFGSGPKINVLERSELVIVEIELVIHRLESAHIKAEKQHALLRAKLEEIGVRNAAVDKATEEFDQQVIIGGFDKISKRIPAEIWLRYMIEWVNHCDKNIGKMRLRTSTANAQYSKLKGQIIVKEELSESLRPVDFEKTKIENQVLLETIDKKLEQLKMLKSLTGDANLNLTIHKHSVAEQNDYLTRIRNDIVSKNVLTKKIEKENAKVEKVVDDLSRQYNNIRKHRIAFEAPDIIEYVQLKSEVYDLRHSINFLQRKMHVQQIALKSLNRQIQSMSIVKVGK